MLLGAKMEGVILNSERTKGFLNIILSVAMNSILNTRNRLLRVAHIIFHHYTYEDEKIIRSIRNSYVINSEKNKWKQDTNTEPSCIIIMCLIFAKFFEANFLFRIGTMKIFNVRGKYKDSSYKEAHFLRFTNQVIHQEQLQRLVMSLNGDTGPTN